MANDTIVGENTIDAICSIAASLGPFASWTDSDLYRAIELPEIKDPGSAQEAEIAEYVEELRKRKAVRQADAEREEALRSKYRI